MTFHRKALVATLAAAALAAVIGGAALAQSRAGEMGDTPIRDADALASASAAALAHTGEGKVTETEEGDEESYYEVEVTLEDGRQVDVQLDESFTVVGDETDDAGEDD